MSSRNFLGFSDGATASGLFLALGFVLEKMKLEKVVDVSLAVRTLRQIRPNFISDMVI
jgi:Protein-tyrosine phosphatase